MERLLECKNIKKTFARGRMRVEALRGVSLTLEKGCALGIVGESGSGKSTLLRIIAGLERADWGEMTFLGKRLGPRRTREELREMQMIFQNAAASFNPRLRIYTSIGETMKNLTGSSPEEEIRSLALAVGLEPELCSRYPSQLSGGQCQRFAIARAISVRPSLLLCDEITSALDVTTQAQILELLRNMRSEGEMSMIFVSHDLAVVGEICDQILVMRRGEIVEAGESRRLLKNPRHEYTRLLLDSVLKLEKETP
ncbi:MAG: ABC transporter ATP-binding protein [Eubacteriales bacterium]|nr:ABC transporter ATP-binding protein [Eubacteriales bacterium]